MTQPRKTIRKRIVLDDVERFLRRFVAFPSDAAAVAVMLWTAHAHLVQAGDSTPRLALLSPEPGSGKTRTLEVLELLVPHPMPTVSASPPAIFRSIAAEDTPTLLMDEVDNVFGRSSKADDPAADLRALLNAGHRKGATIPRCVGTSYEVKRFPVFAAVALAGLGDLPETLMSRSVVVRMRRRAPGEEVEPFRHRVHEPEGTAIRLRLERWASRAADDVADAWPLLPDGISDRPADVWEPLLAVADAAGGEWPQRARAVCVELCESAASRPASPGVRLLGDLRTIFDKQDRDRMTTSSLLKELRALTDAPWRTLDARKLAGLLKEYEVKPDTLRFTSKVTLKGYLRDDLADAWGRYLPAPEQPEQP